MSALIAVNVTKQVATNWGGTEKGQSSTVTKGVCRWALAGRPPGTFPHRNTHAQYGTQLVQELLRCSLPVHKGDDPISIPNATKYTIV